MDKKKVGLTKKISVIALSAVLFATVGTVFITSYTNWKKYYEDMVAQKDKFDKENEPEVTVMTGIKVTVKEGIGFFKNGKANANKSNFIVEGLYTIGNTINKRDYVEELESSEYDLEVPENFVNEGGKLIFSYLKQEPKTDENGNVIKDEEGKEILETIYDFKEEMDITLLDVKLDHLEVTHKPYLITYAEGDYFNSEGMSVDAIYNDGSKIENLNLSLLETKTKKLSVDDEIMTFSYKYGENDDEVIYGTLPIKVMSKNEFTNGKLESFAVINSSSLEVGEDISSFKPIIYGSYSSGNYLKLDQSKYKITGLNGVAEFGKRYNITITSLENPNVSTRLQLDTIKNISATTATLKGATAYDDYVKDFDSGDFIEFTYNSSEDIVANLYLNMSNGYLTYENQKFYANQIAFNDFAYVSINGKIKDSSYTFKSVGPFDYISEAYLDYQRINIGSYALKTGENKIRISFKESNNDNKSVFNSYVAGAIEKLELSSGNNNNAYSCMGEYLADAKENGFNPTFIVNKSKDWGSYVDGKGLNWIYASCTDDEFVYLYSSFEPGADSSAGKECAVIVKYNPNNNEIVGYSAPFVFSGEKSTPMFVKDNFIYTITNEGVFMRLPTSFNGKGTAKVEYLPNMQFEELNTNSIRSMYFNHALRKYAVLTDNTIAIYDIEMKKVNSYSVSQSVTGLNSANAQVGCALAKITGDDHYLYILYKANNVISPMIATYDYEGNLINRVQPKNTTEIMGFDAPANSNVQSICSFNGKMYFTMLKWSKGNNSSIYEISFAGNNNTDTPKETMDLYEYVASCTNKGVTPNYNPSILSGGNIKNTYQYAHGICSDDSYIYISTNNPKGETLIVKVDASTGKTIGQTKAFIRSETWSNGDYMMYKDGYVYLFTFNNAVKRIKTDLITSDNTPEVEDYNLAIEGITDAKKAGTYNATINKMAIRAGDKLYIVGGKSLTVENSINCTSNLGLASDANYIYAFIEKSNAYGTALMNVYDWSGTLVKSGVTVSNLITEQANNNVQGMCVINGECYFLICRWNAGTQVVKVSFDTTILK